MVEDLLDTVLDDMLDMFANAASRMTYPGETREPEALPDLTAPDGARVYLFARTLLLPLNALSGRRAALEAPVEIGGRSMRAEMILGKGAEGLQRILTVHEQMSPTVVRCTAIVAGAQVLNPEGACNALKPAFGAFDPVMDGVFMSNKITRISAGMMPGLPQVNDSASMISDTLSIIAHALTPRTGETKLQALAEVASAYPLLFNCAMVIDPGKLKELGGSLDDDSLKQHRNNIFVIPPYAQHKMASLSTWLLASGAPDFSNAHDVDGVLAWAKHMAEARCHQLWPYRQYVHEIVEHFADRLRGADLAADLISVCKRSDAIDAWALRESKASKELIEVAQRHAKRAEEAEAARAKALHDLEACKARLGTVEHELGAARKENGDLARQNRTLKKDLERRLQEAAPGVEGVLHEPRVPAQALVEIESPARPLMVPRRWEELLVFAEQLEGVRLAPGAVEGAARTLARHELSAKMLANAWTGLKALNAWGLAPREGRGTFQAFLAAHPELELAPGRVASGESKTVRENDDMMAERIFVTSSGELRVMTWQIRIGGNAKPAARMYFIEDPDDGRVDVGYIGPHLRNFTTKHV